MKSLFANLEYRFAAFTAILFLAATFIGVSFMIKQERAALEVRLGEKAAFISSFYSYVIADSLARKDDVTLLQFINHLEQDQEIVSVVVVDQKGEVRYHADPEKVGEVWDDPMLKRALETGSAEITQFENAHGRGLYLVSALKVAGMPRPIGAVKLEMTYRHIGKLLDRYQASLRLVVMGLAISCVGFMMNFLRRWFIIPLAILRKTIAGINPLTLEANLPESSEEFGFINSELNQLVIRIKSEIQNHQSDLVLHAETEKALVDRVARSMMQDARVLIADRDNRVLSDTGNGVGSGTAEESHLLDLITDANFANLVANAFQREGEVLRGLVVFQGSEYDAAVLCIPENQSRAVKTIIALKPMPGGAAETAANA